MIPATIHRHERIALQFSGGKDSLACFTLMRPYLDRITVYYLNTGDEHPDTRKSVEWAKAIAPRFEEVQGRRPQNAYPSDIVPTKATAMGRALSGIDAPVIIDRFECCAATIMRPMYDRMVQDRITLVIRGQKDADSLRSPIHSGWVEGGVEYFFPIEGWSDVDVFDYLKKNDVPIPGFYRDLKGGIDCMRCSAWWDEGKSAYLKRHYPAIHAIVMYRLRHIAAEVRPQLDLLTRELETP